jgi:putative phosphoesterase
MLLGIISDAHGNDEGLALCLEHLHDQGCEKLVFLGDAVGYFQRSEACCRLLEQSGAICLMGNHEAMTMGMLPIPRDTEEILRLPPSWDALPEAWRKQVVAHGPRLELELAGRRILCVHGSPDAPLTHYVRRGMVPGLDFDADVLLLGHTHVPFVESTDHGLVINPGSCGLPRDTGSLLSCAVLDLKTLAVHVTRLPYAPSRDLLTGAHKKVRDCMKRRAETCFGRILE